MVETVLPPPRLLALRDWLWARRAGLLFLVLTSVCFGLTVYNCYPGFMARDSGSQLEQARAFEFWDDHPVLMALIWSYTDQVLPGPAGMLALMTGVCWAGVGVFFWALPGPLWWRALMFLGVGFFPPILSTYPCILKDPLMHGGLLLGWGCLLLPTRRAWLLRSLLALLCFVLALGARHNGAAALWPLLALPLLRLPVARSQPRWLRLGLASLGGIVLSFALTSGVDRALRPLAHRTEFWQTVPTFDLAAMSLRRGELLVEPETQVFAEHMGLDQLRQVFQLDYGPRVYYCIAFEGHRCVNVFRYSTDPAQLRQLSDNWLRAIRTYPGTYLRHRLAFARKMLTVSSSNKELYYLDGAPHHVLAEDYPPRKRTLRVMAWLERQVHRKVYSPWIYVALSALLLPVTLLLYLRGRSALPLLLVLSGASYLLSTLLGATSTNYRYSVWTIECTMLALATLVAMSAGGPARCLREGPADEPVA
ncbi:MAG: hypothetical protein RL033_4427 [Pseudomonadota bacterium]|jgi:hypothetical protein